MTIGETMSNDSIKLSFELNDDNNSVNKNIKNVETLRKAVDGLSETASKANISKKMAAAYGGNTTEAIKSASMSPQESIEYGQARAAVGTGAAGRDFAKQAQGLGGLVHVYATFAANLFAASAAFTALKTAADTTSMIKGLDQLGAASGRNLGQLSKNVAALSDGAVSLREAMTATAQATSAGMSNKNLERLTIVAKNASQALGLNMPDALSRLSRGITKIEPELLDELGIFVKVEEASTNYARTIGKTASSLTDFEKRQAFANAALAQGEAKFNEISMAANPYSKLSASISNLAQNTLELVNKALGPLMTMLSQSPGALLAVLGGIGGVLLKQAIPAIGQYRQNAKVMEEETHKRVLNMVKDQQIAYAEMDTIAAMSAEKQFRNEASTVAKLEKLRSARFNKDILGEGLRSTLKKNAFDITAEETQSLKARSEALLASDDVTYKKQGQKLAAHLKSLEALRAQSDAVGDAAVAANEKRDSAWYSHQNQLANNLDKLNKTAAKSKLLASVADTAAILGPVAAFRQLGEETSRLEAGKAAKGFILLQGALSTVATAAGTAITAFSGWISVIGIIVAGMATVASWMSNTTKETELTSQAIEGLNSSVKNIDRTVESLNMKGVVDQISIEAIQARATAFGELGDSMALATKRAFTELDKMGSIDVGTNFIKKLWGGDVQSTLNKSTADAVVAAFSTMERGPAADAVRDSIKKTLGIVDIDTKSIEKAFEGMSESAKKANIEAVARDLKKAGDEARVTAAKGTELKQSFTEATKQLQDLRNGFIPQDNVSKFGTNIITMASKIDVALKDPLQSLNAMVEVVKDSNSLSFFDPATATRLISLKGTVEGLNNSFISATREVKNVDDKIKSLNDEKSAIGFPILETSYKRIQQIKQELEELKNTKDIKASILLEVDKDVQVLTAEFELAVKKQFVYGAEVLSSKLTEQWAKAGQVIGSTIASLLGDTTAGIEMRAKYEKAALEAQIASINSQLLLIKSNEKLAIEIEQAALDRKKENGDARDLRIVIPQRELDYRRERLNAPVTKGSTASVAADMKNPDLAISQGARESFKYVQQAEAAYAQIAGISAAIDAASIKASVDKIKLEGKYQQEKLDNEATSLKNQQAGIDILSSVAGTSSVLLLTEKQSLEVDLARYEAKKKSYEIETQIQVFEDLKAKTSGTAKNNIDLEIKRLGLVKQIATARSLELEANLKNKQALELANAEYTTKSNLLDVYRTLGGISEQDYEKSKLKLENDKEILATQVKIDQLRQNAKSEISGAQEKITAAEISLQKPNISAKETSELNALIKEQVTLIDNTALKTAGVVVQLNAQSAAQIAVNTALSDQRVLMADIKSATESLTAVFGQLGTSIGNSVAALTNYTTGSAAMSARHKKSLEGLSEDDDKYKDLVKQNTKEREKYDVKAYANMAGAAKSLFKEKSGAYKAFAAVEKAAHVLSIGMQLKETGIKIAAWANEVAMKGMTETQKTAFTNAGFLSRLPTYISEIWASWGAMGPWMAAAAGVFIASKLGGGSRESYNGPSGEDFQKAQGTGQAYDASGNLTDTGYGVFGDSSQKLDSINKSLEILNDTAVKGLDYDNKMLKALNMVAESITGAATQLYSIPGLRQGTNFGTLGGTTSIAAGGLSGALDSILGGLTGGMLGGVGSKLFGGGTSVSASVDAAGIQLKGTFENVMNDIAGSITQYKDILKQFEQDGGWFGSDSSWTERYRETQSVSGQITGAIADIFVNAKDMFKTVGEISGVTAAQVDSAFKNMSINTEINLKGLTGEQVVTELNAVISVELNKLTGVLFGAFDKFKTFGEDLLTTVIRVIDTNTKIAQIMSNLGVIADLKGAFDITEILAKAAGGLDKFIEQANYFNENFYTSAEQVIPTQKAVIKQLDALGLSSVNTKSQLKSVVQSLDLTTQSGRDMYQSIMDLAPGFVEVTDAIMEQSTALSDAAGNFREFAKTVSNFRDSLLISASSTATPLEKYAEAKMQFESTYTAALGGDKDAMSKLTGISQTFLDMSKQFYASSDQYTTDFNTVLDKLEFASLNASASADIAQLQLDNLNIHTTLLTSINANIASIAGVPTAATGGRVSGLTLVGEKGPELVDFTTPGQVYTADQTAGMFTGSNGMGQAIGAMVGEIQQLRAEVSQLRKDQQKQTGDLIISNYDANNKASEAIAAAVVDASQEQAWTARSQSQVK